MEGESRPMNVFPPRTRSVDVKRLGERVLGVLACLLLELVAHVRGRDLASVLAEARPRVRRPRDERVERAHEVEHRAVDHRALTRIGRADVKVPR